MFYHFLSEIKQHTTGAEFQELMSRFSRGYINKDLNTQAMAMDESLMIEDFNFMTGLQKVDEASLAQKEAQSEEKELSLAIAHMAQDREAVKLHWAALKKHKNRSRSDTYEASHDADMIITNHAEAHVALHMPVNIVRPDALAAHISDHVSTWAGKMDIPSPQVLQMYLAPMDKLGLHWHANWHKLSSDISSFIAADPFNAAAFVCSPLVGQISDQYCYEKIREAEREIEGRLSEVDLELAPRDVSIWFDEASIDKNSTHSGHVMAWMVVSARRDDRGDLVSRWAKSYMYRRQKPVRELKTLDSNLWTNPASKLKMAIGRNSLSKSMRTKQWLTGQDVWQGLRHSMLQWLNLTPAWGVAWVDLCPYDAWLPISVVEDMVNQDRDTPTQMVLMTLYLDMGKKKAGDRVQEKMEKERVEVYVQHKTLEHVKERIQAGKLKVGIDEKKLAIARGEVMVSDEPEPTFDVSKLKTSMLSVENWLPLKQEWLDMMDAKLNTTHCRFRQAVEEHDKEVNPSTVPFKGRKRTQEQVAGHGAEVLDESDAITVTPVDITIEALEPNQRAQGNTHQHTPHELLNKDGKLLVLCSEDGVLSKNEYLCQISCKWLCGNDDQAEMAKVRSQSRRWALTTDSPITFTIPKKTAAGWDAKLTTLKDISNVMNADKKRHRAHF